MYELTDRGGPSTRAAPRRHRAGRAGLRRAPARHRPWKVWYLAPNFRYERPQKGRYRQHWQLGAEVLGVDDPDVDVEVIALARRASTRDLGPAPGARCSSTRWGRPTTAAATSRCCAALPARPRRDGLGDEFRARAEEHPLRLLDAKNEEWQDVHRARSAAHRAPRRRGARALRARAGRVSTALGDRVRARAAARPRLRLLHVARRSSSRATRSTRRRTRSAAAAATTSSPRRWAARRPRGSASASGSSGSDRLRRRGRRSRHRGTRLDAFVVDALGDGDASVLVNELREAGLRADRAYGGRSVKAQMKVADRARAAYAVMLGADEAERRHGGGEGPRDRGRRSRSTASRSPAGSARAGAAAVMRTHLAGDARRRPAGRVGRRVRLGREPARPRRRGVPRPARRRRARAGRGRPEVDVGCRPARASGPSTCCASRVSSAIARRGR